MLRTKDRLEEAQFFLEKLKTTNGKGKEFRYYLSALTSAARSITLVLQADLRSKYQNDFDQWWDQRKNTISIYPFSFETIRVLRNTLQKEGHKLPIVIRVEDDKDGTLTDLVIDPFRVNPNYRIEISFRESPTISRIPDETNEELEARIWEETKVLAFSKIVALANRLPELDTVEDRFKLSEKEVYDFKTIVSGFENYLSSIHMLIDEANLLFGETPSKNV